MLKLVKEMAPSQGISREDKWEGIASLVITSLLPLILLRHTSRELLLPSEEYSVVGHERWHTVNLREHFRNTITVGWEWQE